MSKLKLFAIIFSLMIQSNILSAENTPDKTVELEKRISYLEDYKSNIENVSKIEFQKAKEELNKEIVDDYDNVKKFI